MNQLKLPQNRRNSDNLAVNGTWLNAIFNATGLIVTIAVLTVALKNFEVNKKTLEISEQNYKNNERNANDSSEIVKLLNKINQKL